MALFLKMLWDYRKVALYILLGITLCVMAWRVNVWHDAYKRLQATEAALELERACGDGSECQKRQEALEAAQREQTAKVVGEYEKELADLRNRPVGRRVIRVCPDPGNVQDAPAAGTAGEGTAPAGVVRGADEFDTGPLRELAQRADELSAQCRAIIKWNRALAE